MSRSGYNDDVETWDLIRWRGAVSAAIRGKRGQAFLLEMWRAMLALPTHELIREDLERDANVCALGAVGKARGLEMAGVDAEDHERVAALFDIPHALACEIMWQNDDEGYWRYETGIARFRRMKKWIEDNLRPV